MHHDGSQSTHIGESVGLFAQRFESVHASLTEPGPDLFFRWSNLFTPTKAAIEKYSQERNFNK